jgi:hypothetical protein
VVATSIGYQTLGQQFDETKYPWWSEVIGFFFVILCLLPVIVWPIYRVSQGRGTVLKVSV